MLASHKRLVKAWTKTVSSQARGLLRTPTRTPALPVYRANLNHPVNDTEHGKAASLVRPRDRADLTARRVRGRSIGRTEEAKASGNALDMPTSVWSEMAREQAEPLNHRRKQMTTDSRRLMRPGVVPHGAQRQAAAGQYCQADLGLSEIGSAPNPRVRPNKARRAL